jgi:hypothetical protein
LIQNSPYFFYGSPATYALVGQKDQHIWLVTDDLSAAQFVLQAFKSKISLIVFDLASFENYTPTLVDNTVCFDWQVPINVLGKISVLDMNDDKIDNVVFSGKDLQLKNIVAHDILLLPPDRCRQLQQQLMCIHNICRYFKPTDSKISDRVKEIVAVNLELDQIEQELYHLANELISEDKEIPIKILNVLGRLYE